MVESKLRILRLSRLGDGVARWEDRTVFVEGALPDEEVRVRFDPGQKVLKAELLEVLSPSPHRRAPACGHFDRCGGCDWLHAQKALQTEAKEEILLGALEHLGQISREEVTLLSTVASPREMGYRRRATLHFAKDRLGFFARRSHDAVAVDACPALVPSLAALPPALSEALLPIKGDVEEVRLLAEGEGEGARVALSLHLDGPVKPRHQEVAERARRTLGLRGAVLVPASGQRVVVGKPHLKTPAPFAGGVPLYLRPDAFAQGNEAANTALVGAALELLSPSKDARALDLYAGNGNFTFGLAARAGSVLAVESAPVSLELARRGAQEGGVENVRFVQGEVKKVLEGLATGGARFDLALLDPPRAGAPGVAPLLRRLGVRRVVYVACDPGALAKDASELRDKGYSPRAVRLVDMFPQTRHVEAVMSFDGPV